LSTCTASFSFKGLKAFAQEISHFGKTQIGQRAAFMPHTRIQSLFYTQGLMKLEAKGIFAEPLK